MNSDDLISQIPIDQVAQQLGVDPAEADRLVRQAVPALLGGMEANAQDPGGAASLEEALGQHAGSGMPSNLGDVDTGDGEKIVQHVFGDQTDQVADRLGGGGAGKGILMKLLPLIAPLVLKFLADRVLGGGGSAPAGADRADAGTGGGGGLGGGGLGDILGQILGGGGGGGGGQGSPQMPKLDDILGGGRK